MENPYERGTPDRMQWVAVPGSQAPDPWTYREASRYGYPMNPPSPYPLYTRQYHSAGSDFAFHLKWGTASLLTCGLAVPFWAWAAHKRHRPITYTSSR